MAKRNTSSGGAGRPRTASGAKKGSWNFPPYPGDWSKRSRATKIRDGKRCTQCGTTVGPLHAHHKVSLSRGGSNDLSNLTTLCEACHAKEHPHMRKQRGVLLGSRAPSRWARTIYSPTNLDVTTQPRGERPTSIAITDQLRKTGAAIINWGVEWLDRSTWLDDIARLSWKEKAILGIVVFIYSFLELLLLTFLIMRVWR